MVEEEDGSPVQEPAAQEEADASFGDMPLAGAGGTGGAGEAGGVGDIGAIGGLGGMPDWTLEPRSHASRWLSSGTLVEGSTPLLLTSTLQK